jgi:tRNA threonylcarbamoyladenosine biosynthesis protein TsaB
MDFIDSLMKKAFLKPGDLNGVLCMRGPGSFTGLRIGYSIAKGLALSLSIPFVPIPTLDCITASCDSNLIIPVIQARKNSFYYAIFNGKNRLSPDIDAEVTSIIAQIEAKIAAETEILITGPGSTCLYDLFPPAIKEKTKQKFENKGYARELIRIAQNRKIFDNYNTAFLHSGPEYIREPDAMISQNNVR